VASCTVQEVWAEARFILALHIRNIEAMQLPTFCGHVHIQVVHVRAASDVPHLHFVAGVLVLVACADTSVLFTLTLLEALLNAAVVAFLVSLVCLDQGLLNA